MELDPIVLAVSAVLAILAALGWSGAAVFFGLWMGEKGRRRDIALLTGKDADRVAVQQGHATVRRRQDPEETAARAAELSAVANGLMEEAAAAGKRISPEEATKEAKRLLREIDPTNMSG